jgi:mannose/fructose/N-acetylgalactosamine-specific phosphotransferase system component IID
VKLGLSHLGKKVKLRLFKIRVLRKMYGSKTEEVTADWIQQHNEQFHDLHIFVCLLCGATAQLEHRPPNY